MATFAGAIGNRAVDGVVEEFGHIGRVGSVAGGTVFLGNGVIIMSRDKRAFFQIVATAT